MLYFTKKKKKYAIVNENYTDTMSSPQRIKNEYKYSYIHIHVYKPSNFYKDVIH